jgi:AcrR family transcriptional regulator
MTTGITGRPATATAPPTDAAPTTSPKRRRATTRTTKPRTMKPRTTKPRTTAPGATASRDGATTKARIVEAAEEVVLRDGVARLTLDAAAAEAGLSKGGVLYHFPSRDALVAAMVETIVEEYERDIERLLPDEPGPGAFTRAYLGSTTDPSAPRPTREDRLGAALLAAAASEPALLAPLQRAADRWQERLEADGVDPAVATAVRLACDGLWLCDLFGIAPPTPALRAAVADVLERSIGGAP